MASVVVLLPFYAGEPSSKIVASLTSIIESFAALEAPYEKIVCLAFDGDGLEAKMAEISALGFELNRQDVSIMISHNQGPTGLQYNLNAAIKMMKPQSDDLFCRIDCDDEMYQDRLSQQCAFMFQSPHIDIVASRADVVRFGATHVSPKSVSGDVKKTKMFLKNQIVHSSVCFRGSVFSRFGFYDEAYRFGQDYEFWLRVLSQGGKIHILPDSLVRLHQDRKIFGKRLRAQRYYLKALLKWPQLHWAWIARTLFVLLLSFAHIVFSFLTKSKDD